MNTKAKNRNTAFSAIRGDISKYFSLIVMVGLIVVLTATQQNFLGEMNLKNLLRDTAPLMTMSSGMTMVLLFGSIDLSMGAVCSVSNVIYVHLLLYFSEAGFGLASANFLSILSSLLFGFGSGLALGVIHVKFKVPSFIASLGFMSLWQSVALLISQNPESVSKSLWDAIDWYRVSFGVICVPLIFSLGIILIMHFYTRFTPSGRSIYAIGGNERTARVCGLNVGKTKIMVFSINGILAALAGIFLAANLRSSSPTVGDAFTLKIVAACALGGTSLAGGKGGELGTILGVFTVAIIENGMSFIGVSAYYQNIVFGIFVLAAIALTVDRSTSGQVVK